MNDKDICDKCGSWHLGKCREEKDTPQSNTDWREEFLERYGDKIKQLIILDHNNAEGADRVADYFVDDMIESISQLLEAEKKRWREACVKKSVKDLWPDADTENPTELLATQIAYKNGYNAALDAVLQKLS